MRIELIKGELPLKGFEGICEKCRLKKDLALTIFA